MASGCGGVALILVAIIFWLFGVALAAFGVLAAFHPAGAAVRNKQPYSFVLVLALGLLLPSFCLMLFGLASWRHSARLAIYGLLLLIPTAILYGIRLFFGSL